MTGSKTTPPRLDWRALAALERRLPRLRPGEEVCYHVGHLAESCGPPHVPPSSPGQARLRRVAALARQLAADGRGALLQRRQSVGTLEYLYRAGTRR